MFEKKKLECFTAEIPIDFIKQWLTLDDRKSNEKLFRKSLNKIMIDCIINQYQKSLETEK